MNITAETRMRPARDRATMAIPVVAFTCLSVHVVLLVATGTSMLPMTLSMLALSGLCVACMWRARGAHARRDHLLGAAASLTMIVVHLVLMPSATPAMGHGTDHAGMDHSGMSASSAQGLLSAGVADGLMQIGIALAVIQLVLAVGVSALRLTSPST